MSANPSPLTHFDAQGQAHMVDVAAKAHTHRVAVATGRIRMQPATLALIQSGTAKKGDVLGLSKEFVTKYLDAVHLESINHQNRIMND